MEIQWSLLSHCCSARCPRHQVYVTVFRGLASMSANLVTAAVERVPEIKAEAVEEVFFGNVLSAG